MPLSDPAPRRGLRALPRSAWGRALTSLFMDVPSEMIHSLLPLFLSTVLGASMTTIGVIEGLAEATVAVTKVFSGGLSDFLRRRHFRFAKPLHPHAWRLLKRWQPSHASMDGCHLFLIWYPALPRCLMRKIALSGLLAASQLFCL